MFSYFIPRIPIIITRHQFLEIQKNAETEFNFVSEKSSLIFQYKSGKAAVIFKIYNDIYKYLLLEDQKLFKKSTVFIVVSANIGSSDPFSL